MELNAKSWAAWWVNVIGSPDNLSQTFPSIHFLPLISVVGGIPRPPSPTFSSFSGGRWRHSQSSWQISPVCAGSASSLLSVPETSPRVLMRSSNHLNSSRCGGGASELLILPQRSPDTLFQHLYPQSRSSCHYEVVAIADDVVVTTDRCGVRSKNPSVDLRLPSLVDKTWRYFGGIRINTETQQTWEIHPVCALRFLEPQ